MNKILPYYLTQKIAALPIKLSKHLGYLEIYTQLKLHYPSLNFQALFDLFCYYHNLTRNDLTIQQQRQLVAMYKTQTPNYSQLAQSTVEYYLTQAQLEANKALELNEIPIGAVITYQQQIIGRGFNQTRQNNDILAHAELIAIQAAQTHLNNHRLTQCDLYVTIEPCLMCSGAILNTRIQRLIFGALEPKTGACQSQYAVFNNKQTNHHTQVIGPINQEKYSKLIQEFLRNK